MGPLEGIRVVEMAGIGPAPFAGMLLADMGAEVVRVDRLQASGLGVEIPVRYNLLNRGKRSVALNLKSAEGVATVLRLIERSDILIEGFRPGVMEKLGLGPEPCLSVNPRLAYGRMTGWGQEGPLSKAAGHDINYIALTGALDAIGPNGGPPVPPLNLLGDFGGGSLYLVMGVLAAHIEALRSGRGQVVDAAIVDGTANLMTMVHAFRQIGAFTPQRGSNLLDGGTPFYGVYETSDARHVAIGPLEPKFYDEMIARLGLHGEDLPAQYDKSGWPRLRDRFTEVFRTKTRAEWSAILEGTDACFAPVLTLDEAQSHPHMAARHIYASVDDVVNPAPAPRFSQTPSTIRNPPSAPGADTAGVLESFGFDAAEIARLKDAGVTA